LIETLSTEEFSLRTQYLQLSPHICREVWGVRQERDGQHKSQPDLHTAK
jgi:hypothetical protein